MRGWWIVVLLPLGCGDGSASGGPTSGPADERGSSSSGMVVSTTSTGATSTTSGPSGGTSTGADATDGATSSAFITPSDGGGGVSYECDLFEQNCRPGYKCTPYSNDGGAAWNATHCVPVARDPASVGEPCVVQDHAASGNDDCEAGSVCWGLDESLQGQCVAHCGGTARRPSCADGYACFQASSAALSLCLLACDPLTDTCGPNGVCAPGADAFVCWLGSAQPGAGHGQECNHYLTCADGTQCIGADAHTACPSNFACCSTVCDVASAEDPCPDLDPNQTCQSWFEPGMAPEGYEHVGVCALPL